MNETGEENTAPASLIDLVDQLNEVPEPPPVSMMPQTWGWAVLGLVVAALLALGAWRLLARYRANAYRRAALAELDASGGDPARIAAILKRTALAAWPRREVAGLAGSDWLRFLDAHGGEGFCNDTGRVIAEASWRRCDPDPELVKLARNWIRRHKASGSSH